jgi:putative transposase
MVCRAFTFLLQPTVRQATALERLLDAQRELYNAALEERRGAWRWERRRVTKYEQYRTLTGLRAVRPDVLAWGVTVCPGHACPPRRGVSGLLPALPAGGGAGIPPLSG